MQQRSLDEYMAWPWTPKVEISPEGDFRLTVDYIRDFEVFAATEKQLSDEWRDALRSHLMGYLAVGKIIPVPEFTLVRAQATTDAKAAVAELVIFMTSDLQIRPTSEKLQTA